MKFFTSNIEMQWINLPCQPHDSLDWNREIALAKTFVDQGKRIIWKCNLGLESAFYPLDDEMHFQAASLAMGRFSEIVWPEFKDCTEFVCLYRGSADFEASFSWTPRQLEDFARFSEEEGGRERLFAAESFAIYFQMLSHRLPDEANVLLLFDVSTLPSPVIALQAISKERFEHFTIGFRGMDLPLEGLWWEGEKLEDRKIDASVGVVFPVAPCDRLETLLSLSNVKVLFESFISEEWEGLDQIYVVAGSLSTQGMRKLSGFRAAGGEIIEI